MDSTNPETPKGLGLLAALLAGSMMLAPEAHAALLQGSFTYQGSVLDTFEIQSNGGVDDPDFGSIYIDFKITNDALGYNAITFGDSSVYGSVGLGYNSVDGHVIQYFQDFYSPALNDGSVFNIQTGTYYGLFGDNLTFAVPEPATWAMMVLGIGGLGASLRSRRKAIFSAI